MPMWSAGSNHTAGLSLVELIVTLSLLTLMLAIAGPGVYQGTEKARAMAAVQGIAVQLSSARQSAMRTQSEIALTIDVNERSLAVADGSTTSLGLPETASLRLLTANSERVTESAGRIRFFGDGSSTGGSVNVAYRKQSWKVDVHWLTGRIRVTP